jgi:hypothetical protein
MRRLQPRVVMPVGRTKTFRARWAVAAACLFVSALGGCKKSGLEMVPIHGDVSYNGAPLQNVTQGIVRYTPKEGGTAAREATGRIQPDGTFVLTTFKGGDGVVAGEYNITVTANSSPMLTREQTESGAKQTAPKSMIPDKYHNASTSGLSDSVNSSHSGVKKIELHE